MAQVQCLFEDYGGGGVEEIMLVFYTCQIELQQQICIITIQRPWFILRVR